MISNIVYREEKLLYLSFIIAIVLLLMFLPGHSNLTTRTRWLPCGNYHRAVTVALLQPVPFIAAYLKTFQSFKLRCWEAVLLSLTSFISLIISITNYQQFQIVMYNHELLNRAGVEAVAGVQADVAHNGEKLFNSNTCNGNCQLLSVAICARLGPRCSSSRHKLRMSMLSLVLNRRFRFRSENLFY